MLEKDLSDLTVERQQREDERRMIVHRFQEAQRVIDTLQEQIRELKIQHNEETSNLRKKVNILTDQLEAGPAPAMSAAPSSTGFTDFNAEMEALNMGPHDWDNFIFVNELQNDSADDFTFDTRAEPAKQSPVLEKRPSSSTVVPSTSKKPTDSNTDQPIATGLLFMLLLCGAFVASGDASSQPRDMPNMPAEVRAAAPTVLSNLLSEAGSSAGSVTTRNMHQLDHEPQPSGLPYNGVRSNSRLEQMHHRLTSPTKQQEIEQVFAITPAQYASINNMDYQGYDDRSNSAHNNVAPRPRRNLAEALANVQREHQQSSKAEVYTRSLLWDQIPADVVKQFREMVAEHDKIDARRSERTSHDDMYGYKTEP